MNRPNRPAFFAAAVLAAALCGHGGALAAESGASAEALARQHAGMAEALSRSPFGRPLIVQASASDSEPGGQVFAVVEQAFDALGATLQQPANWCALMLLQTNIKRCSVVGDGANRRLEVAIARRMTDPVDEAEPVSFRYRASGSDAGWLSVALDAEQGPVGTRDYSLRFEAVPIGPGRSFVHLSYDYRPGYAARMATRLYLSTAGRDKVGFSVAGTDDAGRTVRVGGIQGVVERNAMRYFLAIESVLGSRAAPPERRLEQQLRDFHAALERYPEQLHETRLDEYLAMKRREIGGG